MIARALEIKTLNMEVYHGTTTTNKRPQFLGRSILEHNRKRPNLGWNHQAGSGGISMDKMISRDDALAALVDDLVRPFIVTFKTSLDDALNPTRHMDRARLAAVDENLKKLQKEVNSLKNENMSLRWKSLANQRGSVLVIVCMLILALLAFLSIAISSNFMTLAATESARCADSIALAGANALYSEEEPEITDVSQLQIIGEQLALANDCQVVDIQFGHWNGSTFVSGGSVNVPIETWPTDIDTWYSVSGFVNAIKATTSKARPILPPLTGSGTIERSAIAMTRFMDNDGNITVARGSWLVK